MTKPQVLRHELPGASAEPQERPALAWRLVGWMGFAFAVVGGADLALAWYPFAMGNPEWEFGTITQTLNGVPVPALGVVALMAAAAAAGRRHMVRLLAAAFALAGVLLLAMGVLYLTSVPLGLQAVVDEVPRLGLKKAIARSVVQVAGYSAVFLVLAVVGWRGTAENVHR